MAEQVFAISIRLMQCLMNASYISHIEFHRTVRSEQTTKPLLIHAYIEPNVLKFNANFKLKGLAVSNERLAFLSQDSAVVPDIPTRMNIEDALSTVLWSPVVQEVQLNRNSKEQNLSVQVCSLLISTRSICG